MLCARNRKSAKWLPSGNVHGEQKIIGWVLHSQKKNCSQGNTNESDHYSHFSEKGCARKGYRLDYLHYICIICSFYDCPCGDFCKQRKELNINEIHFAWGFQIIIDILSLSLLLSFPFHSPSLPSFSPPPSFFLSVVCGTGKKGRIIKWTNH